MIIFGSSAHGRITHETCNRFTGDVTTMSFFYCVCHVVRRRLGFSTRLHDRYCRQVLTWPFHWGHVEDLNHVRLTLVVSQSRRSRFFFHTFVRWITCSIFLRLTCCHYLWSQLCFRVRCTGRSDGSNPSQDLGLNSMEFGL